MAHTNYPPGIHDPQLDARYLCAVALTSRIERSLSIGLSEAIGLCALLTSPLSLRAGSIFPYNLVARDCSGEAIP